MLFDLLFVTFAVTMGSLKLQQELEKNSTTACTSTYFLIVVLRDRCLDGWDTSKVLFEKRDYKYYFFPPKPHNPPQTKPICVPFSPQVGISIPFQIRLLHSHTSFFLYFYEKILQIFLEKG